MPGPIDEIIGLAREAMGEVTAQLIAGRISPAYWQRECQNIIRRHIWASYATGLGREPTREEERALGRELNRQYRYLRDFTGEVKAEKLSDEQTAHRIGMYADRLKGINNQGENDALDLRLPQVPGDGRTRCLTNCKCYLDIRRTETGHDVYWRLTPAEHCEDCVRLSEQWNPLKIER